METPQPLSTDPTRRPTARLYSEDEVREILNRAAGMQLKGRDFSRDHLVEMASELGISTEQVVAAERAWLDEQRDDEEFKRFLSQRRQGFRQQVITYVLVIGFLAAINLFTSPDFFWFVFPALGWGMGLAFGASNMLQTEGEEVEKEYDKWLEKQQERRSRGRLRS